jgi:hypothetical protein
MTPEEFRYYRMSEQDKRRTVARRAEEMEKRKY